MTTPALLDPPVPPEGPDGLCGYVHTGNRVAQLLRARSLLEPLRAVEPPHHAPRSGRHVDAVFVRWGPWERGECPEARIEVPRWWVPESYSEEEHAERLARYLAHELRRQREVRQPSRSARGFTVVELLVVIFILFFLLLTALPRFVNVSRPAGTPDAIRQVDAAVSEMVRGSVAFNTPGSIPLGYAEEIQLLVSPSLSPSELASLIEPPGGLQTDTVRVTDRMEAQLSGSSGLTIQALTPSLQVISSARPTEWRWAVTPTDGKTQFLFLTLSAHLLVDEDRVPAVIDVFRRQIEGRITPAQRVSLWWNKYWEVLVTAIAIPLAIYLFQQWRNRREKGANDEAG